MGLRSEDWLQQGRHDLRHARLSADSGDFAWACFAAHQGAEKILKAVHQRMGHEAWGHSVRDLVRSLPESVKVEPGIEQAGTDLDKHYIGSRYPNSYPQGAPFEYYTSGEAERAIANAGEILRFCEGLLP